MQNKVIVVTGAAGALGSVLASELARNGAKVVGVDQADLTNAPNLAGAIGNVDLTDSAQVRDAFDRIATEFGAIDGLAQVAGGFVWETIEEADAASWDRMYAMNVRATLLACRAAIAVMSPYGGALVTVGATAATKGGVGMGAYAASKSGVARLTESLAAEVLAKDIRVNAVLPSIIDTEANRAAMPEADFTLWVAPEALSAVIIFLLSGAARAVTGALVPVTGRL